MNKAQTDMELAYLREYLKTLSIEEVMSGPGETGPRIEYAINYYVLQDELVEFQEGLEEIISALQDLGPMGPPMEKANEFFMSFGEKLTYDELETLALDERDPKFVYVYEAIIHAQSQLDDIIKLTDIFKKVFLYSQPVQPHVDETDASEAIVRLYRAIQQVQEAKMYMEDIFRARGPLRVSVSQVSNRVIAAEANFETALEIISKIEQGVSRWFVR